MPGPAKPFANGNPTGGRPRLTPETREARALAQRCSVDAVRRLIEIMGSDDERAAIVACNAILDRGMGKPAQVVTVEEETTVVVEVSDARDRLASTVARLAAAWTEGDGSGDTH